MMERQYELLRKEHMKEIDDGKLRPAEETHSAPVEPVGNLAEKVNVQSHQEVELVSCLCIGIVVGSVVVSLGLEYRQDSEMGNELYRDFEEMDSTADEPEPSTSNSGLWSFFDSLPNERKEMNISEEVEKYLSEPRGMEILGSAYEQDLDQIAATKTAEQLTSTVSSQKMNTPAVLPRASTPQPQIPTQPISQTQQPLVSVNHHHNPYQQYSSANTQSPSHPQYSPYHQPYLQSAPQHSYFQPYPYHVQRHYHSPQHSTDNITAHQVIWMNDRFMTRSSCRDKLTD
uniref:(California timema) hypothetical protein n=1 Tax=Timema californicum TaxID=61474 RepID=A0A7R9PA25_TIMCA|nr:unnamed protein product [Timema californicum]